MVRMSVWSSVIMIALFGLMLAVIVHQDNTIKLQQKLIRQMFIQLHPGVTRG